MIRHHVDGRDRPLFVPQLAKKLGVTLKYCYKFVKKMCDLRIMAREDGRLYINPIYFYRGKNLKQHLFFMFEEDLASILPDWAVERFYGNGF